MRRSKKKRRTPSDEAILYVTRAAKQYVKMKEQCAHFEKQHPTIVKRGKIEPSAFSAENPSIESTFIIPKVSPWDQEMVDQYLADKEKVFLIERGFHTLDEASRQLAEDFFIRRLSRTELEAKWHLSQATLTRYRKGILNDLALEVDDYMNWKAEYLFL